MICSVTCRCDRCVPPEAAPDSPCSSTSRAALQPSAVPAARGAQKRLATDAQPAQILKKPATATNDAQPVQKKPATATDDARPVQKKPASTAADYRVKHRCKPVDRAESYILFQGSYFICGKGAEAAPFIETLARELNNGTITGKDNARARLRELMDHQ